MYMNLLYSIKTAQVNRVLLLSATLSKKKAPKESAALPTIVTCYGILEYNKMIRAAAVVSIYFFLFFQFIYPLYILSLVVCIKAQKQKKNQGKIKCINAMNRKRRRSRRVERIEEEEEELRSEKVSIIFASPCKQQGITSVMAARFLYADDTGLLHTR